MTASGPGKKKRVSLLNQVAVLFVIGVIAIGIISSFVLHSFGLFYIKSQLTATSAALADDLTDYINEYPAHDWLLRYWYEHYDQMDIEYDVHYTKDTQTAGKYRTLTERNPGFMPDYADTKDVEALTEQDQKLYAEIVYSWLITRMDQMQKSYEPDYMMCIVVEEPYDMQFVLFIAASEGDTRGMEPGQIFPIGRSYPSSAEQQRIIRQAAHGSPASTPSKDGKYLDYYTYLASVDEHQLLLVMARDYEAIHQQLHNRLFSFGALFLFFMVALAAVCLSMINFTVLRPLAKIQKGINLYKNTKDSDAVVKKLAEVRSRNELATLSEDVASMTKEIESYTHHIEKITSEREKIDTELSLASRIQTAMLPNVYPPYPDRHDFEVYGSMTPAKDVGGDFYDFFLIDDDHLAVLIADVSGKGIPAALFMMAAKITLAHNFKMGKSPAQILEDVNESICAKNPEEMFVTTWLGILDLKTGKMTASNAGHDYPMLTGPDGTFSMLRDKHGMVLGAFDGAKYTEYEIHMQPGSRLFLYTDGLSEANNVKQEMFTTDRILEELNKAKDKKPKEILDDMKLAVSRFAGEQEQFDDLTMICLLYNGPDKDDETRQ